MTTDVAPGAALPAAARSVLAFWFGHETDPGFGTRRDIWFRSTGEFDRAVEAHCGALHHDAAAGRLNDWAATPLGSLARVILLDQIPRNVFRGTPRAYATDALARVYARAAIDAGFDRAVPPVLRWFFYLPFEHSESLDDQELSVTLFEAMKPDEITAQTLASVHRHHEIIERFGRFPHRNVVLGRKSTPEEEAFLKEPNSSF